MTGWERFTDSFFNARVMAQYLPKIIEGRVNGFFKERVLLEQSSVQDSKKTVKAYAAENGAEITGFVRIEIGG